MAGEWIKMRVSIIKDSKVIMMTDFLSEQRAFMDWLTDPVHRTCKESCYEHVTPSVTRAVTVSGLLQVWGLANERGKPDGADIILEYTRLITLDEIAGIPMFGAAMSLVGWAVEESGEYEEWVSSVRFPGFMTMNTPVDERKKASNAERQKNYRERKKDNGSNGALRNATDNARNAVTSQKCNSNANSLILSSLISSGVQSSLSSSESAIVVCAQEEEKPEQQKQEPTVSIPFEWREGVHEDWEKFADAHHRLFPKWVRPELSERLGDWSRAHAKYGLAKLIRALEWLAQSKKTEFTRGHLQNIPAKYLFRNLADCIESSQSAAGWEEPTDSETTAYDPVAEWVASRKAQREAIANGA